MEESLSTSASTVRTLHQWHSPMEQASQTPGERGQQGPLLSIGSSAEDPEGMTADPGYAGIPDAGPINGLNNVPRAPSSPPMHAFVLPSPPDSPGPTSSPSIDSVSESSLPSVSSSFFFSSSAPGSPGRSHPSSYPSSHPHSDHDHDHDHEIGRHHTRNEQGLIIPSLTLPDTLRRPTPFGQTLGNLRVLVLGAQGAGKSFLTGLLLEDNEDVVDVGTWEDWHGGGDGAFGYGKVLRASTDWAEQQNVFGLDRYEPSKNVEIVELPGYSHDADVNELITRLKAIIETPFRTVNDFLHPDTQPSATVVNMLAAATSPFYTALVFLLPAQPTPLDREIISSLSKHIPLIPLPRLHGPHRGLGHGSASKLSEFRPASAVALRSGLFHSPETVALLREEAVDRFLRWREVERAVEGIWEGSHKVHLRKRSMSGGRIGRKLGEKEWGRSQIGSFGSDAEGGEPQAPKAEKWSKARWEAQWMASHSQEVATRMREGTITERSVKRDRKSSAELFKGDHGEKQNLGPDSGSTDPESPRLPQERQDGHEHAHMPFDPLHLPSLLMFSVSIVGPLRRRVTDSVWGMADALGETRVKVALVGGFCLGLGLGVCARVW
ncbi:hypothetical protein GALMADRAFT_270524 [Galerina marginata CBS 339.88]|uniref:Septin-type G domain-containing protein n=1 Tax=Galerina marginata (strain CBS 339.88) TaxID=685588 RepID=A0A067SNN5_GALM3|nr:hypothetical protein GALMADRAFT_270524 [Galerina marginata CBS 339.88]